MDPLLDTREKGIRQPVIEEIIHAGEALRSDGRRFYSKACINEKAAFEERNAAF